MAGIFQEAKLTKQGIALLAKAQAGKSTIKLTKAAAGDGSYSPSEDLSERTALKAQKQTFPLTTVTVQNKTNVFVKFIMSNKQDSGNLDDGEILYAIAIGVQDQWDYMPAYNDLLPSTITIDFLVEVSNAETVTIETPNSMYLYDTKTGEKYVLGVENGLLYFQKEDEGE